MVAAPSPLPGLFEQVRLDVWRTLGLVNGHVNVSVSPPIFRTPGFTVGTRRIGLTPTFFQLPLWHQYAVMLHEYMHSLGIFGEREADLISLEVARRAYGDSVVTRWFQLRAGLA